MDRWTQNILFFSRYLISRSSNSKQMIIDNDIYTCYIISTLTYSHPHLSSHSWPTPGSNCWYPHRDPVTHITSFTLTASKTPTLTAFEFVAVFVSIHKGNVHSSPSTQCSLPQARECCVKETFSEVLAIVYMLIYYRTSSPMDIPITFCLVASLTLHLALSCCLLVNLGPNTLNELVNGASSREDNSR